MMDMGMGWLVAAGVIVLALAVYAGYLHWQLHLKQKLQREKFAELEAIVEDERTKRVNSVRILAQGVIDDQLSLTEAAIRITALLDNLGQGQAARAAHPALFKLADETLHIPRLEAWRALSRKDKRRYDQERAESEKKYRDFVVASARTLVRFNLSDAR